MSLWKRNTNRIRSEIDSELLSIPDSEFTIAVTCDSGTISVDEELFLKYSQLFRDLIEDLEYDTVPLDRFKCSTIKNIEKLFKYADSLLLSPIYFANRRDLESFRYECSRSLFRAKNFLQPFSPSTGYMNMLFYFNFSELIDLLNLSDFINSNFTYDLLGNLAYRLTESNYLRIPPNTLKKDINWQALNDIADLSRLNDSLFDLLYDYLLDPDMKENIDVLMDLESKGEVLFEREISERMEGFYDFMVRTINYRQVNVLKKLNDHTISSFIELAVNANDIQILGQLFDLLPSEDLIDKSVYILNQLDPSNYMIEMIFAKARDIEDGSKRLINRIKNF